MVSILNQQNVMNLQIKIKFLSGLLILFLGIALSNQADATYKVHVIGDSHSHFSFTGVENCIIHWLGPITMHRVGKKGLRLIDVRKFDIKEGDTVIFVFGEIDVRCHIGKQRDLRHRNVEHIIENLVQNYIKTLLDNRNLFTHLHYVVCSVLPPTNQSYNPQLPIHGSLQDRIFFTNRLNRRLHEAATAVGLHFLEIPKAYAIGEGYLDPLLSDGVHIGPGKNHYLKGALDELLQKLYYPKKVVEHQFQD